ncbi:MAG: proton-conducting membrane transporter, partial [Armatimonadetes bacterium]|nr:proton-conducting membrane transporter [Armatimonadota bacterium]
MTASLLQRLTGLDRPERPTPAPPAGRPPDCGEFVCGLVERMGRSQEALIPILQAIQREYRYLPEAALRRVVRETEISAADLMGAATFYSQFRLKPVGLHMISVCHGTACHVKGSGIVDDALRRHLKLQDGDDTDADGLFTMTRVACVGCCTLAPVIQVDGLTYGHLNADNVGGALEDFLHVTSHPQGDGSDVVPANAMGEVRLALDSCCIAGGTMHVRDALAEAVRDLRVPVAVRGISCSGLCHQIPLVEVAAPGKAVVTYARFEPRKAEALVRQHFQPVGFGARVRRAASGLLDRWANDDSWEPVTRYAVDMRDPPICAYLGPQKQIAMEHAGESPPLDLVAYIERDGFAALRRCATDMG